MKPILLIGGSGQLGTELRRVWGDRDVVAPSHAAVDLERTDSLAAEMERVSPSAVINCAAFHNVDLCETQPERAMAVNALAVERAARLCRDRQALFVTIGTDYVFDGRASRPYSESDPPNPISAYGVSKLAGELLVRRLESAALIVRTCGVYGVKPSATKGHTFVDRIIGQARAGEPVRVVRDVVASPTFAGDLAGAIRALVDGGATGLYHAADAGAVSWYDFACEALAQAGIDHRVEPIESAQWKAGARRPAFSALDCSKLRAFGHAMPSWQDGIRAYLRLSRLSVPPQSP